MLLPVEKWFGKQNFTAVGYRWAAEASAAFVAALGVALQKALSTRGGKLILGGGAAGAGIGLAIGGPIGAAAGAAIGVGAGAVLNHYWPRIVAGGLAAFHKIGSVIKQALGPKLWSQIISLARSFWDTVKAIGGYLQNHVYPVVKHIWDRLGGWHTVGVIVAGIMRTIASVVVTIAQDVRTVYNAIQTVVHWIQRAANAVSGKFTGAWNAVVTAVDIVSNAINGIVSAIRTAVGLAQALASALPDNPFSGGPGGAAGRTARIGQHRALGGPVVAGGSYLVGERGPELFSPRTSGMITPNTPITVNVAISQDTIAGIARVEVLENGKRTARTVQAGRKW